MEKPLPQVNSETLTYMHVSHHSPAFPDCPTKHHRWRRDRRGSSVGCSSMEYCMLLTRWVILPFFTLLVQGHLPYTSTVAQLLPSYYACSSITLLTASDTEEKSQMTNFISINRAATSKMICGVWSRDPYQLARISLSSAFRLCE